MTAGRITQGGVTALGAGEGDARIIQGGVTVLGSTTAVLGARVVQAGVTILGSAGQRARVIQAGVVALVKSVPCVTRLAQCWILRRADGEVLGFTAHDETLTFAGVACSPCDSLRPSASEAASEVGAVGNMELGGIIASDAISEFDLYAGKYDGCYVEVWDVPWGSDNPVSPRRLAAGITGAVSHGRRGFTAEVMGIGAQAQQQALTQVITPACRFVLGDARCKVDLAALTVAGTVTAIAGGLDRRTFADSGLAGSPAFEADYFVGGVVEWLTGENAGIKSEVKSYDSATGTFVLWRRMPAALAPGDTFTASPGCDLSADNCRRYDNFLNFGGYPDVVGDDAVNETPNAKM